jgi:3-deoxy-manno-octulosonate cytidylyltransferase (CMP-KDO synthetase)
MKIITVIPARFKSSRFPGKPLAKIAGISMIERVYNNCKLGFDGEIIVATDDSRIINHCNQKNISVILTSENCLTGTDRVAEVSKTLDADVYINIQGDEPLFNPDDIKLFIQSIKSMNNKYNIYAGYTTITDSNNYYSNQIPKMLVSQKNELIYTSRSPIPANKEGSFVKSYRQVCIYGYTKKALLNYSANKKTPIEKIEDLELLRFIELEYKIKMIMLSGSSVSVDNPEDILKVENKLKNEKHTI